MDRKLVTSQEAPLFINSFPQEVLPIKGTIGMTMAPGKKGSAIYANWNRDLDADLDTLKTIYKTDIIISLMEDFEFDSLKIPNFREKCAEKSIVNIRFNIVDGSVPKPEQVPDYIKMAKEIKLEAENGKNIVIHCMGGLGRTGTLAACLLVLFGHSNEDAIRVTRQYRKGAIETKTQENFVETFRKLIAELKE